MDRIALLLLPVFILGCGRPEIANDFELDEEESASVRRTENVVYMTYTTNPVFNPYINRFKNLAIYYNRSHALDLVAVIFDESFNNSRAIGACIFTPTQNLVIIRQSYWSTASELMRENLIFHELGHCALYRPHRVEFRPADLTPISLMYTYILNPLVYETWYDEYLNELFQYVPAVPLSRNYNIEQYITTEDNCDTKFIH